MAIRPGSDDYREGALCRLKDAQELCDQHRWVGSAYLAGRAVEGILRSLLWKKSRKRETGHDLRELLKKARFSGMLTAEDPKLEDALNEIAVVWNNNMRFIGERAFLRHLKDLRMDRGIKGDPNKEMAKRILEACESVVARGELAWRRYKKS